jgi:hypothetical protein
VRKSTRFPRRLHGLKAGRAESCTPVVLDSVKGDVTSIDESLGVNIVYVGGVGASARLFEVLAPVFVDHVLLGRGGPGIRRSDVRVCRRPAWHACSTELVGDAQQCD